MFISTEVIINYCSKWKMDISFNYKTPETVKLLGSMKKWIDISNNGENALSPEVVEVVLVQRNLVDNQY